MSHRGIPRRQTLRIFYPPTHSANTYYMPTVCQRCSRARGVSLNKANKPVSAWNISVHSRRIPHSTLSLIHQRRPRLVMWFVPWDWSCLQRAGKISVRKWAGGDGCLRATLSLCPALLGGEAFPRLGEALHFRNNPLRCFWLLKHVTMATDKLHYRASENHLLDFNLLFKDGEDYKSCNNTSRNILPYLQLKKSMQ